MTIFSGCVDDPGTTDWANAARSGSKSSMPTSSPSSFSSSDKSLCKITSVFVFRVEPANASYST